MTRHFISENEQANVLSYNVSGVIYPARLVFKIAPYYADRSDHTIIDDKLNGSVKGQVPSQLKTMHENALELEKLSFLLRAHYGDSFKVKRREFVIST